MTNDRKDFRSRISELLDNYVDGWDVFKTADDWDYRLELKPESEEKSLPKTWLELADKVIGIIATEKYGLDVYPNVIEVISAEQMLDAYTKIGLPVSYDHWSFGKHRIQQGNAYQKGMMGLAFEIVINSNPAHAYLMENNTKTMQMLVIAHASYGHNYFFKNNHLFKQFTDADTIIPDMMALRDLVREYEDKYGVEEVEKVLDACHALESHSVDRYKKPRERTPKEEAARRQRLEEARERAVDVVMDTTVPRAGKSFDDASADKTKMSPDMEENLLRFMAAYAPHLDEWQRDLMRRIADKAQYFYPQSQTKVMNEGCASFWHYTLMGDLYDMDLIDDGMYLEFIHSHSSVLFQPDFDDPRFGGINPYTLGFNICNDIKRMCQNPTEEDREWFPDIAGNEDWLSTLKEALDNYKDESFILQYLSPKVMREMKLFAIADDANEEEIEVAAIHNDGGYRKVREVLASQHRLGDQQPRIEVEAYDFVGDRSLTLRHTVYNDRPLHEKDMQEILKHTYRLWKHPVILKSVDPDGNVLRTLACPANALQSPKVAANGPAAPSF